MWYLPKPGVISVLVAVCLAATYFVIFPDPGFANTCPNGDGYYPQQGWSDVSFGQWHYEYIRQVTANEWLSGSRIRWRGDWWYYFYPSDNIQHNHWRGAINRAFGADLPCGNSREITRAQAASDLIRAAGLGWVADEMTRSEATNILRQFPDYNSTPSSVYKDVAVAVKYGIINGVLRGNRSYLEPTQPMTRAQAATMISRIGMSLVKTDKQEYTTNDTIVVTGEYRGLGTINRTRTYLFRDNGRQLDFWVNRDVLTLDASNLTPGRYYVIYRVETERRECISWYASGTCARRETVTSDWESRPAVFEVLMSNYITLDAHASPNPVRQFERFEAVITIDTNIPSDQIHLTRVTFNGRDMNIKPIAENRWHAETVIIEPEGLTYLFEVTAEGPDGVRDDLSIPVTVTGEIRPYILPGNIGK